MRWTVRFAVLLFLTRKVHHFGRGYVLRVLKILAFFSNSRKYNMPRSINQPGICFFHPSIIVWKLSKDKALCYRQFEPQRTWYVLEVSRTTVSLNLSHQLNQDFYLRHVMAVSHVFPPFNEKEQVAHVFNPDEPAHLHVGCITPSRHYRNETAGPFGA